jgi:hypothetical protein
MVRVTNDPTRVREPDFLKHKFRLLAAGPVFRVDDGAAEPAIFEALTSKDSYVCHGYVVATIRLTNLKMLTRDFDDWQVEGILLGSLPDRQFYGHWYRAEAWLAYSHMVGKAALLCCCQDADAGDRPMIGG